MATIVCQGLQSCLESHHQMHHEPRTIRLKLSCFVDEKRKCPNDDDDDDDDEKRISSTTAAANDSHCWSFLQAISNNNGSKLETANKETTNYVHPLDTRSKSALSEKSLELCTENLGSETGTDIIEESGGGGGIFSSPSENGRNVSPRREQQKCDDIKKASPQNFPPPLSTITGVTSLQVRPQREDGRLIIKAIKAPSPHCSVFQAERSHGRLRLSLFEASDDEEVEEIENEIAGEEEQEGDVDEDDFEEENDGYMEIEEEEEEEEVNGENRVVGGEMGIKKFQMLRRCKEGEPEKKGLLNWEALWVASS